MLSTSATPHAAPAQFSSILGWQKTLGPAVLAQIGIVAVISSRVPVVVAVTELPGSVAEADEFTKAVAVRQQLMAGNQNCGFVVPSAGTIQDCVTIAVLPGAPCGPCNP